MADPGICLSLFTFYVPTSFLPVVCPFSPFIYPLTFYCCLSLITVYLPTSLLPLVCPLFTFYLVPFFLPVLCLFSINALGFAPQRFFFTPFPFLALFVCSHLLFTHFPWPVVCPFLPFPWSPSFYMLFFLFTCLFIPFPLFSLLH